MPDKGGHWALDLAVEDNLTSPRSCHVIWFALKGVRFQFRRDLSFFQGKVCVWAQHKTTLNQQT